MKNLLAVQKEIGTIKKDKENPFFKSKYADINSLLETVKPVLNKHDLVVVQPLVVIDGKSCLATKIIDGKTGEIVLDSAIELPNQPDPQKMGSAITYFRRYALQSLLSLEAEDDDGNHASQQQSAPIYDMATDGLGLDRQCAECGGPMTYKEGTSKQGKPFKGWFCTEDRKHPVQWVK